MWLYEASFGWGIVVGLFPFLGFVFTCFTQGLLSMGFMVRFASRIPPNGGFTKAQIYRTLELWDRLGPSKLRSSLLLASVPYIALVSLDASSLAFLIELGTARDSVAPWDFQQRSL